MEGRFTRRALLRAAGGALAVGTVSGTVAGGGGRAATGLVQVNVGFSNARGRAAARRAARSVDREFGFGALTVTVPQQAVAGLSRNPHVRYVEENGVWHAIPNRPETAKPPGGCSPWPECKDGGTEDPEPDPEPTQALPWGIDRVDADVAHASGNTGAGAHVAIIDSGIDADHPDLQTNLGAGVAFVNCRGGNCLERWDDDNDHGTHCAGIAGAVDNSEGVVGVAPGATLHAVKVLDKRGSGSWSDVAAGIEYVADQGWDVASMSLGGGHSSLVADAVAYADSKAVLLVAAAGNDGPCTDCVGYPAAYPEVVAVGSTTSSDSLSSFSSTGPEVEIAAPGSAIFSTVPGGRYDTFSGTSMACPHVSGAGAQLMAGGASASQARNTLMSSAEDIGLSADQGGVGLLDVAAALGLDSSDN